MGPTAVCLTRTVVAMAAKKIIVSIKLSSLRHGWDRSLAKPIFTVSTGDNSPAKDVHKTDRPGEKVRMNQQIWMNICEIIRDIILSLNESQCFIF